MIHINMNDDIDDKIFALLNSSHLCIADLTHARPSVYYEAGVLHGAASECAADRLRGDRRHAGPTAGGRGRGARHPPLAVREHSNCSGSW